MCSKWEHYFEIYEHHFSRFLGRSVSVLEIGVQGGGSLQMWRDYFGPLSNIVGVDIDPAAKFERSHIHVEIGDQADPAFMTSVYNRRGPFDIIIDDGSHVQSDMQASFKTLYPSMPPDGVYLLEDMCCCYWSSHGGGCASTGLYDGDVQGPRRRVERRYAA